MFAPHSFLAFALVREAHRSWTIEANSFSERLLIAKGTKLFVGGKIFGQEEEPAPLPEVRRGSKALGFDVRS